MKYKCGHKTSMKVIEATPLVMAEYFRWSESTGLEGDKSECYECFIRRTHKIGGKKQ